MKKEMFNVWYNEYGKELAEKVLPINADELSEKEDRRRSWLFDRRNRYRRAEQAKGQKDQKERTAFLLSFSFINDSDNIRIAAKTNFISFLLSENIRTLHVFKTDKCKLNIIEYKISVKDSSDFIYL